jgi:hypothetical protein
MRNIERFARPVPACLVLVAAVQIHSVVECSCGDPFQFFCGVGLGRLSKWIVSLYVPKREKGGYLGIYIYGIETYVTYLSSLLRHTVYLIKELLCDVRTVC